MAFELAQFYSRSRHARKIIVVDLGFLGDSVHLVPALWELQRHYPGAELHTLSAPVGAEVLALAPCVRRAWAFPLGPKSPPWWRHWNLIGQLRRERFEVAFNFSGADRTIFLTALLGARWRVAHAGGRRHFYNPWLIPHWVSRREAQLPVYEQRRQVLAACGLSLAPAKWELALPEAARQRAQSLAPSEGAIHLSPNASSPLKEWPLEHWIELAQRLLAWQPQVCLVASGGAGTRERERLAQLQAAVPSPGLLCLPPGLSLAELAAVLRRCRLHVGGDSGVLHLARALGLPTLSLFRDYHDARAWMPEGPGHRVLSVACQCVNQSAQPCLALGRAQCLGRLSPAQLEQAIQEQLAKAPGTSLNG